MNRKEKIELELERIIEIGKKKGEISMDIVTEKFANLNPDEIDEVLKKITDSGIKINEDVEVPDDDDLILGCLVFLTIFVSKSFLF